MASHPIPTQHRSFVTPPTGETRANTLAPIYSPRLSGLGNSCDAAMNMRRNVIVLATEPILTQYAAQLASHQRESCCREVVAQSLRDNYHR